MRKANIDMHYSSKNRGGREVWQAGWRHYVQISKRRSSSARITAENFIKLGRISGGARILDLGCGHGRITELLVERVPFLKINGVDMTQRLLDSFIVTSGSNQCTVELVCADIIKLPFDDAQFDVAVSSRVFQYLADPILGVREAVRVLKPGGRLVISIPNKLNVIRYLTHDQKLYSPFEVRDWFTTCGLEEIEYGSMCFFPSLAKWQTFALSLERGGKIPVIKYCGGNVVVKGKKTYK